MEPVRVLKDIAFGSFAGMVAKVFEHPFDLCKVRLQSQVLEKVARFDGPIDCLYKTWKYEGVRGLYRGLLPPVAGAAAENATLFLVYNNIRRALAPNIPSSELSQAPFYHILIAAAGGGAATSFVLTPIELVKCKMQVQMIAATAVHRPATIASLPGPLRILRSVIAAEGVRGLWLGHTGTFIRETGGSVVWFGAKELVSNILLARRARLESTASPFPIGPLSTSASSYNKPLPPPQLKAWESAVSGACAGVAFSFLLFPADCVKSTIQTEEELRPRLNEAASPKSTFSGVFKEIYRTKGIRGLYAGCGVTVARSAPSSALIFLIYDALERSLG
ncbi:hypothetical protein BS47DRAFT_1290397 [Hydnum rufescens UP504]|uniref:Mitochondrial carrier n=1 Tax=Hydnum rufescens UP504 TaxID=1448309 RepID=A0A9P6B5Q0_9AGAM|nr:hypothetical protein BS47DRAFT_1290397 [Hydnum rufescens UP504]